MADEERRSVNTKARQIIEKVRADFGYTFEEIGEFCGVSVGSVQRWYSTGRAKADKIVHIEKLLSNVRLTEGKVAENLIEIYWHRKAKYRLTYLQLKDVSGRERLSPVIIGKIQSELDDRGFVFLEEVDNEDGKTYFILLRRKWCLKKSLPLTDDDLKDYYYHKVEEELEEEGDGEDA